MELSAQDRQEIQDARDLARAVYDEAVRRENFEMARNAKATIERCNKLLSS